MTNPLGYSQLEQLWVNNGGPSGAAPTAAAISVAEASGVPDAKNLKDPNGGSYGLWQINGVHAPGGDPQTPTPSGVPWWQSMLDPNANAAEAVAVSNRGTDFTPWTSYSYQIDSNGQLYYVGPGKGYYTNYLDGANSALANGALAGTVNTQGSTAADTAGATAQTASLGIMHLGPFSIDFRPVGWFFLGLMGLVLVGAGGILLFQAWTKNQVTSAAGSAVKKAAIG